jgi:hypothetical protein
MYHKLLAMLLCIYSVNHFLDRPRECMREMSQNVSNIQGIPWQYRNLEDYIGILGVLIRLHGLSHKTLKFTYLVVCREYVPNINLYAYMLSGRGN